MKKNNIRVRDLLIIFVGTAVYSFGLTTFNMPNDLAEGGVTGITLIIKALFNINPALSNLLINIPLILIGGKVLGTRSFIYTIWGTASLSANLWIWQQIPVQIFTHHDLLIAALLAGFAGGIGNGLVYRFGGTTGGTDIVARLFERHFGMSMGRSLFIFDVIVLLASLVYVDIVHMMYTLISVFVFSRIVDSIQEGAYSAKGLLIMSDNCQDIATFLMQDLERGVTFLKAQGGYSKENKDMLYCVVSAREIPEIKLLIEQIDDNAFLSIINVHEVVGEGFSYGKPSKFSYFNKKE